MEQSLFLVTTNNLRFLACVPNTDVCFCKKTFEELADGSEGLRDSMPVPGEGVMLEEGGRKVMLKKGEDQK